MDLCERVKQVIEKELEGATVIISDPRNDGVHLEAIVISDDFDGKSHVQRHRRVMISLENLFASDLHALALKTFTQKEWENEKNTELGG